MDPGAGRIFKEMSRGTEDRRRQQRLRSCLHSFVVSSVEFEKNAALQSLRYTGRIY